MATPLKIRDVSGNIQELTTAEENYIAYQIGLHLAADSANGVGGITTNSSHTSIGTYTNTFFNEPVGTHPETSITSGSSLTTLYQNQGTAAETDSDVELPMMWIDAGGETGFKQMPSADLDAAVDRYLSTIFTSDYPGAFKLASAAPGVDYSVWLSTVFTDTRTDGTSVAYNIYRRDVNSISPPAAVRPMYVRDDGGFDGIQAMTNRQIKYSFGQRAKTRIGTSKIGTYQLRSAAAGAPTDPGTWISAGAATDTKQTTSQQDFTTVFTAQYATNYTKAYTKTYTGDYLRTYTGNYTNVYTGAYNTVYTGNYLRTFVGNYTRAFAGSYARAFGGVTGGVFNPSPSNFAAYFARNYTNTYVGTYQRDASFAGGSVTYQGGAGEDVPSGAAAAPGSSGGVVIQGDLYYVGYSRGGSSTPVGGNWITFPAGDVYWWGYPSYMSTFVRPLPASMRETGTTENVNRFYASGPDGPTIFYNSDRWLETYPRFGVFAFPLNPGPTASGDSLNSAQAPVYLQQYQGSPNPASAIDGVYSVSFVIAYRGISRRGEYVGPGATYTVGPADQRWMATGYQQDLGVIYSGPGTMRFASAALGQGGSRMVDGWYISAGAAYFGGSLRTSPSQYVGPSNVIIYYTYTGPSRYQGSLYVGSLNYTGTLTFEQSFNRAYQRNYTSNYEGGPYDGVQPANYTGAFVGYYDRVVDSINYTSDFISTSNINYSRSFATDYVSTTDVTYASTTDVSYDTIYTTDYITDYIGNFEGLTIDATNETIETYTLYVRIS